MPKLPHLRKSEPSGFNRFGDLKNPMVPRLQFDTFAWAVVFSSRIIQMEGTQARHRWVIPSLKLIFTVSLAGGSLTACDSWFIVLEPLDRTS